MIKNLDAFTKDSQGISEIKEYLLSYPARAFINGGEYLYIISIEGISEDEDELEDIWLNLEKIFKRILKISLPRWIKNFR